MYVVQLVKPIPALRNPYADNYFPRKLRYLKDAKSLAVAVLAYGGVAEVVKQPKEVPCST